MSGADSAAADDGASRDLVAINVGALVWAGQRGFPFWPAMVTYDPELGTFHRSNDGRNVKYHVQFFGIPVTRAWMPKNALFLWTTPDGKPYPFKEKPIPKSYQKSYDQAMLSVTEAFSLKIPQRLMKFVHAYMVADSEDDEDEEEDDDDSAPVTGKKRAAPVKRAPRRDPDAPRRALTAVMIYTKEKRGMLLKETPTLKTPDAVALLAQQWAALPDAEKAVYQELEAKDKERFDREMEDYVPSPEYALEAATAVKPKRARSAYNHFTLDVRAAVINSNPDADRKEVTRLISQRWKALAPGDKARFEAIAAADLQRYTEEMSTYVDPDDEPMPDVPTAFDLFVKDKLPPVNPPSADSTPVDSLTAAASAVGAAGPAPVTAPACLSDEELKALWDALPAADKAAYDARVETERARLTAEWKAQKGNKRASNGANSQRKRARGSEHLCVVCEGSGATVVCAGKCRSRFHQVCLGLATIPEAGYKCEPCTSGIQSCFACGETTGTLFQCTQHPCVKNYHQKCAEEMPRAKSGETIEFDPNEFICPLHTCANCDLTTAASASGSAKLLRCIRCPVAYHAACVPAGVDAKDRSQVLCARHLPVPPKHPSSNCCLACGSGGALVICDGCPAAYHEKCVSDVALPDGDVPWFCVDCVGGCKAMPGDIVWGKVGAHRWWPCEIVPADKAPAAMTSKEHEPGEFLVRFFGSNDFFYLAHWNTVLWAPNDHKGPFATQGSKKPTFSRAIEEAQVAFEARTASRRELIESFRGHVKEQFTAFQRLSVNKYTVPRPAKMEVAECSCSVKDGTLCGEDCLNRLMWIECGKNCPVGELCMNHRFQKRDYPPLKPFKTDTRGWGLRSTQEIQQGDFVIEYVGEIISDAECRSRMEAQTKAGTPSFYFLSLDVGLIIDAKAKANLARFINHSCDPNCSTQVWNVAGEKRVGIFATRYIPVGEELTFDYQLDSLGNEDRKPCTCGAQNCSGFIGKKPISASKLAANAAKENAAKSKKKPLGRKASDVMETHDDHCFACADGGSLVCCDFKDCFKAYHVECLSAPVPSRGKWHCPAHSCNECEEPSTVFCKLCPHSFCTLEHAITFSKQSEAPVIGADGLFYCWAHPKADIDAHACGDHPFRVPATAEHQAAPASVAPASTDAANNEPASPSRGRGRGRAGNSAKADAAVGVATDGTSAAATAASATAAAATVETAPDDKSAPATAPQRKRRAAADAPDVKSTPASGPQRTRRKVSAAVDHAAAHDKA